MDGRRRRGGSPDLSYGDSSGIARNRSVILRTIHGCYKEALDLLPLEDKPELVPRLLAAGVCFGFADPVTNIVANTICFLPENEGEPDPDGATGNALCLLADKNGEPEPRGPKKRKRKMRTKTKAAAISREEVLSKIVAGSSPPEARIGITIAERSLEGLITFLTSYFCHLPAWDALRYLCLAKADLLVAVRLVEQDRCYRNKDEFCISSYAANTALKYAALSVRHPNVDGFHTSSMSLAYRLKSITQTVLADRTCSRLSIEEIHKLSRMLKKPCNNDHWDSHISPMLLAHERLCNCNIDTSGEKVPGGLTISLRAVLIDRIHARYLKAISRLPTQDVRVRYHRGLVKAGYCYGPLDPVTNIIVNTIWYDTVFPPLENLEVDMICSSTFVRVKSRSLSGLIKLLLTCVPEISEHDAMVYLLKNNMKVKKAIRMARAEGCDISDWDISAYKAAAMASFHPEPDAYVEFVMQSLPLVQSAIKSLLKISDDSLSSSQVLQIASLLSPSNCNPAKTLEATLETSVELELSDDALEMFMTYKEDFVGQQSFFRKKIESALRNKGYLYELHVICGVNERVGSKKSFMDFECPYSHVNFFARPKNGSGLELFFAEFSNGDDDQSLCCIVSNKSVHVRCCYCEYEGIRIVHPDENYCGGDIDFRKMACGEHDMSNEMIIGGGKLAISKVGICGEDYIYLDPTRDTKLVQGMNLTASRANASWSDIMKIAQT